MRVGPVACRDLVFQAESACVAGARAQEWDAGTWGYRGSRHLFTRDSTNRLKDFALLLRQVGNHKGP